jgi:hypothetical protein
VLRYYRDGVGCKASACHQVIGRENPFYAPVSFIASSRANVPD